MPTEFEIVSRARDIVRARTDLCPLVAVTLGSGLGALADEMTDTVSVSLSELPDFPVSTAEGHDGRLIFGYLDGIPLVVLKGRVHGYEGYTPQEVVRPVRLLATLGVRALILTNAAGGIGEGMQAGDLMLLSDHISSFVHSPLQGPNEGNFGTRFPDMSAVYDPVLRGHALKIAKEENLPLREGVYLQTSGPNYETPTEIRMYRALGADAVGMSTAVEAIAARHAGLRICGISCISNLAAGISPTPLSHEEVQETANRVAPQFRLLIRRLAAAADAEVRA
ncbi:MAG: purine-nucleoside phosphorylase [Clostridia bacterium]|nr:purine-nucleoside phosphorylase [Clostridia bacterium]